MSDDEDFMQDSDQDGYVDLPKASKSMSTTDSLDTTSNTRRTMTRKRGMSISKINTTMPNR
jgi:hypothetical protein